MTTFLRLLTEKDKAINLLASCTELRAGNADARVLQVVPESFRVIPGAPFAYWVSEAVRQVFKRLTAFEREVRTARQGLATAEDFRFVRTWWEVQDNGWKGFAKGGAFSKYYADLYLLVNWRLQGLEIKSNLNDKGSVRSNVWMLKDTEVSNFFRPGLTWPLRTQSGLSMRAMPGGCIFSHKGPAAFVANDSPDELLALLAIVNSSSFALLVSLQISFGSYEVGVIQKTPIPDLTEKQQSVLSALARQAWSLKRTLDTIEETSHAFLLPAALRGRCGDYDPIAIEAELARIQTEIDDIAFDLYGFSEADRAAASQGGATAEGETGTDDGDDEEEATVPIDQTAGLLSWAIGVAFGRFDWRLATGERQAPAEPEPFDPLPARSPGMLPDGLAPFHAHPGILVDDAGHPHDLARLVEEVLVRVEAPVPEGVRRWLQRDFFAFHLPRYSKSRRKAPIYWPLSTSSGSYTLWIYYPMLTSQTLYTAVNNFVEPKIKQTGEAIARLRPAGSTRSRGEERQLEELQEFEQELTELRDTLLRLAPGYQPNHDDGVQITAAPLWPLFRHKPWQKVLRETWAKLEKGDYDWAHLAMSYWPERVREKCRTDKSLAIAHGLEELYIEPEGAAKVKSGRKRRGEKE
jgi:hypothetical protein